MHIYRKILGLNKSIDSGQIKRYSENAIRECLWEIPFI